MLRTVVVAIASFALGAAFTAMGFAVAPEVHSFFRAPEIDHGTLGVIKQGGAVVGVVWSEVREPADTDLVNRERLWLSGNHDDDTDTIVEEVLSRESGSGWFREVCVSRSTGASAAACAVPDASWCTGVRRRHAVSKQGQPKGTRFVCTDGAARKERWIMVSGYGEEPPIEMRPIPDSGPLSLLSCDIYNDMVWTYDAADNQGWQWPQTTCE